MNTLEPSDREAPACAAGDHRAGPLTPPAARPPKTPAVDGRPDAGTPASPCPGVPAQTPAQAGPHPQVPAERPGQATSSLPGLATGVPAREETPPSPPPFPVRQAAATAGPAPGRETRPAGGGAGKGLRGKPAMDAVQAETSRQKHGKRGTAQAGTRRRRSARSSGPAWPAGCRQEETVNDLTAVSLFASTSKASAWASNAQA